MSTHELIETLVRVAAFVGMAIGFILIVLGVALLVPSRDDVLTPPGERAPVPPTSARNGEVV